MGKYYTKDPYVVADGNIVYAKDWNNPSAALEQGIESLVEDTQTGAGLNYVPDTGVADAYVVSLDPAPTAYKEGLSVWLKANTSNTGASTINVNSLGDIDIKRHGLDPLDAGDIPANYFVHLKYSNGAFQIVSADGKAQSAADSASRSEADSAINAQNSANCSAASYDYAVRSEVAADHADQVLLNVTAEGDTQIARVETEGGDVQVARVISEGNNQVTRVENEGTTQVALATAQADASADSANQSLVHANNSEYYATQAQSVVNQDLSALKVQLRLDSVPVAVLRGSLSEDSDGGAWAKRCEDLSWYNETLNTATRGKTREFPHEYLITLETGKLIIHDATDPECPMWRVLVPWTASISTNEWWRDNRLASSVSMQNGKLFIGKDSTGSLSDGLSFVDFINDSFGRYNTNTSSGGIASPISIMGSETLDDSLPAIINNTVNTVAMVVLPDAPIDQTTGIQVPTIIVGTDGGFSAIDGPAGVGTVKSVTSSTVSSISISEDFRIFTSIGGAVQVGGVPEVDYGGSTAWRDYFINTTSTPALKNSVSDKPVLPTVFTHADGLTLYKENPQEPTKGMVAYMDAEQAPMWQLDPKGAFLASTTVETIGTDITTEHVVNGTFDKGVVDDWLDESTGSGSTGWGGGLVNLIGSSGANKSILRQAVTTQSGKTYRMTVDRPTLNSGSLFIGYNDGNISAPTDTQELTQATDNIEDFIATGTTSSISLYSGDSGGDGAVANASVREYFGTVINDNLSSIVDWTPADNTNAVVGGGILTVTSTLSGQNPALVEQSVTTVTGRTYKVTCQARRVSADASVVASTTPWIIPGGALGSASTSNTSFTTIDFTFVATGSTTYFSLVGSDVSGQSAEFDYIVVDELGSELFINGDFATGVSGWIEGDGWSIASEVAIKTAGVSSNLYQSSLELGQNSKLLIDVVASAGFINIYLGSGTLLDSVSVTGSYEYTGIPSGNTNLLITSNTTFEGSVDNISVKAIQNKVVNGEFSSARAWTISSGGWVIGSGVATTGGVDGELRQGSTSEYVDGQKLLARFTMSARTVGFAQVQVGGAGAVPLGGSGNSTYEGVITVGEVTSTAIRVISGGGWDGNITDIELYELTEPDRSYNDNPMQVVGQIDKVPVATGAELVGYSGFTASNYLEQPYNPDFDFGTGDFYVMGWFNTTQVGNATIFDRSDAGVAPFYKLDVSGGVLRFNSGTTNFSGTKVVNDGVDHFFVITKESGVTSLYVDDVFDASAVDITDVDNPTARLYIGTRGNSSNLFGTGLIPLIRIGAGVPSAEQMKHIYETEKKMFEPVTGIFGPTVRCTLSNSEVTAEGYDASTGIHTIGTKASSTSGSLNTLKGLVRTDSIASEATGIINSISVGDGSTFFADALESTSLHYAEFRKPAYNLREELEKKDKQLALLKEVPQSYEDATTGLTDYKLPQGTYPIAVYQAGLLESTSGYTIEYDGYTNHVVFGVATTGAIHVLLRRIK